MGQHYHGEISASGEIRISVLHLSIPTEVCDLEHSCRLLLYSSILVWPVQSGPVSTPLLNACNPVDTYLCNRRLGVDVARCCNLLELVDQLCDGQTLLRVHLKHRSWTRGREREVGGWKRVEQNADDWFIISRGVSKWVRWWHYGAKAWDFLIVTGHMHRVQGWIFEVLEKEGAYVWGRDTQCTWYRSEGWSISRWRSAAWPPPRMGAA